jgi:DNA-binding XRE family transcriptional regulator
MLSETDIERIVTIRRVLRSGVAAEIREAAGASRAEVAASVDCHPITVAKWETGERTPRTEVALRLADVYGHLAGAAELFS